VWTATPNGQIDYLNARFYEFSGTKPEHSAESSVLSQSLLHLPPTISTSRSGAEGEGMGLLSEAGGGWLSVVHPADYETALMEWGRALAVEGAFEMESRLRSKNGEYCWHLIRALPVPDTEGRLMKWFGTCTNIEEQKRAEQERILFIAYETRGRGVNGEGRGRGG
jgi:PAS domain S-box-containing protein